MPHRKSSAKIWRQLPKRYRMEGSKCYTCLECFFPARDFCPNCRRTGDVKKHTMQGKGKIFSYTTTYVPLEGFERQTPYTLAIVQLEEGPKITSVIVDCEPSEVEIGMRVRDVFRRISEDGESGIIHYGYKFCPE